MISNYLIASGMLPFDRNCKATAATAAVAVAVKVAGAVAIAIAMADNEVFRLLGGLGE